MDHLNSVHQSRQGVNDLLRGAAVKRFNEFLKIAQILNVVLSLIQLIGEQQIQTVVFHHELRDGLIATGSLAVVLLVTLEINLYVLEILGLKLF